MENPDTRLSRVAAEGGHDRLEAQVMRYKPETTFQRCISTIPPHEFSSVASV